MPPLYEYACENCEERWEDVLPISRRKEPEENPCPSCCMEHTVIKVVDAPKIAAGDGNFHSKIPDWFKDRVKDIKKQSGRKNTIDI